MNIFHEELALECAHRCATDMCNVCVFALEAARAASRSDLLLRLRVMPNMSVCTSGAMVSAALVALVPRQTFRHPLRRACAPETRMTVRVSTLVGPLKPGPLQLGCPGWAQRQQTQKDDLPASERASTLTRSHACVRGVLDHCTTIPTQVHTQVPAQVPTQVATAGCCKHQRDACVHLVRMWRTMASYASVRISVEGLQLWLMSLLKLPLQCRLCHPVGCQPALTTRTWDVWLFGPGPVYDCRI